MNVILGIILLIVYFGILISGLYGLFTGEITYRGGYKLKGLLARIIGILALVALTWTILILIGFLPMSLGAGTIAFITFGLMFIGAFLSMHSSLSSNEDKIIEEVELDNKAIFIVKTAIRILPAILLFSLLSFGGLFLFDWIRYLIVQPIVYEELPIADTSEPDFYKLVQPSPFIEINAFRDVSLVWWNERDIPLVIANNTLFMAGHLVGEDNWKTDIGLFSVNIETGEIKWRTTTRSHSLAVDTQKVYTAILQSSGEATGVVAYDQNSGEMIWQTAFDYKYAIGITSLFITGPDLSALTYHRGNRGFYVLNRDTGERQFAWFDNKMVVPDKSWITKLATNHYLSDEFIADLIVLDELTLVKKEWRLGPVTALSNNDGSVVWQTHQSVASNIAVDGDLTYFVTEKAQLMAVETQTGKILNISSFIPEFGDEFDFLNTSILVAADNDIVAVYFEDSQQLSIYRFDLFAQ